MEFSNEEHVIELLIERFERERLPRLLDIHKRVTGGETLEDGDIAFLSSRQPQFAYCWVSPVGIVHRMDRNGKNVRRLSSAVIDMLRWLFTSQLTSSASSSVKP